MNSLALVHLTNKTNYYLDGELNNINRPISDKITKQLGQGGVLKEYGTLDPEGKGFFSSHEMAELLLLMVTYVA